LGRKGKEVKAGRTRDHWLEYGDDKYSSKFLAEAKVLMKVLFLYIPLPFFWALFDQQVTNT
jgi:solute carrier family 15 oligopeptide transporter 1